MNAINADIAEIIDCRKEALAEAAVTRCWEAAPELGERYGEPGRRKCIQDVSYHFSYLSNAIAVSCPELFADYLAWAKVLLTGLGIPVADVTNSLNAMSDVLQQELSVEMGEILRPYITAGLQVLASDSAGPSCFIDTGEALRGLTRQYVDVLLKGDRNAASRLILDAVESGASVQDIYLHVFQQSQYEIGRLWQTGQISVAQEHLFTAATQLIMSQLYSHVFTSKKNGRTLVAACVGGDLHEIGCRMVADFFEMDGWDTLYFGASTPTPSIVEAVRKHGAEVLAISATMTFHARAVANLITAVRAADPGRKVTIMVGGYPFKVAPDLWRQVGADLFAHDAQEAVARMRKTAA